MKKKIIRGKKHMNKETPNKVVIGSGGGGSITFTLTILLIILKLNKVINWSWIWVLSPFLIGLLIFIATILLLAILFIITEKD
jgi:hypothetical protein